MNKLSFAMSNIDNLSAMLRKLGVSTLTGLGIYVLSFMCATLVNAQLVQSDSQPLTAEQWLQKMQVASVEENYLGTFVLTRGNITSTMNIVHRYKNGVERERLKQLDGEMGEIIRTGTEVMCIFPDNRVVRVEQNPFSNKLVQAFSQFSPDKSQYTLSVAGVDRMVDRTCMAIDIRAKDKDRYSFRLWLDKDSGLLLRSSLHDGQGNDLERFQYTDISFPDEIEDKQLKSMQVGELTNHEIILNNNKDIHWPSELSWQTDWVPLGYKRINGVADKSDNVMVYSDGLATYSIFIEKVDQNNNLPEGMSQVGATIAYSHQQEFSSSKYNVTVIGEIPAHTAMKIAESIQAVLK